MGNIDIGPLLDGIASIVWPLIIVFVIWLLRKPIKGVLESAKLRKFTIKVGEYELTMEEFSEQQRVLISDLQEQIIALQSKPGETVSGQTATEIRPSREGAVLWVDDNPENNSFLIAYLSDLRVDVVTSTSTSDGLAIFNSMKFGLIVSDIGRKESNEYNQTAGLDLLKAIRQKDKEIPVIFYTSSRSAKAYREEANKLGANEVISSPTKLLDVLRANLGIGES